MKKQKENSHEGITWSEMGKQNVQAEKVYWRPFVCFFFHESRINICLILNEFEARKASKVFFKEAISVSRKLNKKELAS